MNVEKAPRMSSPRTGAAEQAESRDGEEARKERVLGGQPAEKVGEVGGDLALGALQVRRAAAHVGADSATEQAHASSDDGDEMKKAPSVWVAYLLFFSGGLFGIHHIYLRRPFQVQLCTAQFHTTHSP